MQRGRPTGVSRPLRGRMGPADSGAAAALAGVADVAVAQGRLARGLAVAVGFTGRGAGAAVAILFIYAGGLLDNVLDDSIIASRNVLYAIAFVSGFTERLIFAATNKVAGEQTK